MRYCTTARTGMRHGFVVPFTAVCLTLLIGMCAFAIDLGMMSVARTQVQHAADMAALSGARTLNGDSAANYNANQARPAVDAVATGASILQTPLLSTQVAMQIRPYVYDPTLGRYPQPGDFPAPGGTSGTGAGETRTVATGANVPYNSFGWSMIRVTVGQSGGSSPVTNNTAFGGVFGMNQFDVKAIATAVHRPRDLAMILDFSGSMQYSSQVRFGSGAMVLDGDPESGNPSATPNYPNYAYYNQVAEYSSNGVMTRNTSATSGAYVYAPANIVISTPGGEPIVRNFYYRDGGGTLQNAFHRTMGGYAPTASPQTPAPNNFRDQSDSPVAYNGDKWPRKNNTPSNNWAQTVVDFLTGLNGSLANNHAKDTTFETNGYGTTFLGYSMGPGYYGKTFYIWPPDPRTPTGEIGDAGYVAGDWRKRFYINGTATTGVNPPGPSTGSGTPAQRLADNSLLFNANGLIQTAATTRYRVDYDAVLRWINRGPQVFPPNLRSGRVLYYTAIPTTIRSTIATGSNATSTDADQMNELFWKKYIDYVLSAAGTTGSQLYGAPSGTGATGGAAWGTVKITARSLLTGPDGSAATTGDNPYMHYNDQPRHPRLHFWFGPLSMISFIWDSSGNQWPGTCHESQSWQLKTGIQAALIDIERNHPNDQAALIYFSSKASYATARVQMSRNYTKMRNALWYPFNFLDNLSNVNLEGRPYTGSAGSAAILANDTALDIPNADGSTCPEMGFKAAYNEFSARSSTPGPYYGRRDTQKFVIYETDGIPNTVCPNNTSDPYTGDFSNTGAYTSYFSGFSGTNNMGDMNSTVINRAYATVRRLCAPTTNDSTHIYYSLRPGYGDRRLPTQVHAIGFGDLFEPSNPGAPQNNALDFLNEVELIARRVTTPAITRTRTQYLTSGKVIFGDSATRIEGIRKVMESIMQTGVPVTLIE